MLAESAEEAAYTFHETLLEVLKLLNQAAEERGDGGGGLEYVEIERALRRFWTIDSGETRLDQAVGLLHENGLVRFEDEPVYAWDRKRTIGARYLITTLGKSYLVRQVRESERIR